ncbi:MAG: peptidoglycan-binding protein [Clostridia bacterium]|nr:peptidoglycan-binding protein [Clostridia bacterium]
MKKTVFAKADRAASVKKRVLFAALMVLACLTMSGCIVEPDRVMDDVTTFPQAGQNFSTVVTNTPVPTNTPTPTPPPSTGGTEVDFSGWHFGDNTPTNPPANNNQQINNNPVTNPNAGNAQQNPVTITVGITTNTPKPDDTPKPSSGDNNGGSTSSGTLKQGSSGAEVKALQNRLKELGYYKGSVDGDYGSGTIDAVKAFQRANNLSVDGKAGPQTQKAVYSNNAIKANATNVNQPSGGGNTKPQTSTNNKPNPTTPPSTYTNGRTDIYLELGSSNHSQVKILQNRLIVLGYLTGTADGEYGEATEAAVKAFQKRNSIYVDGKAGPETLTKLYSASAKKASAVVGHLGSLEKGSQGAAVRNLQKQLKDLGYYSGSIDGDYGDGTVAAVTAFQQNYGLTADGVAGKATQNAIYSALNGGGSTGSGGGSTGGSSNPDNYGKTASSNGYTTVSQNSGSVSNVAAVQSALSAKGYYNGNFDGDFGSGTEQAVRDYQAAMGLRVTGMAGPCTQRLLFGGTNPSGSYSKLEPGSTGSKVKTLQYALYELKFYDGEITGTYDTATENAVLSFQIQHGLYADGIAGQQTQATLFSSDARPFSD